MNFGVLLFLDQTLCLQGHIFSQGQRDSISRFHKHLFVLLQTSFPYRAFESLDRYHFVFSVTHKVIFFPFKTHFCWNSTQYSVMTYMEKESKKEWIYVCVCVLSYVRLFATLWTVAHQAASSMAFSRQEHWSGIYVYI